MSTRFELFTRFECFEFIFQNDHVLVGKIKDTQIYFSIAPQGDFANLITSWYHNDTEHPCITNEIPFENVLDLLGKDVSDEILFNLQLFKSKRVSANYQKEN